MCGIAGTINFHQNTTETLKKSLHHRGPDEFGSYSHKNIQLVHTRLSIQDIAHGHQPFEHDNYIIIFNGEIYNHLCLRKEFLKDFDFKTHSDTETLLYMYIKYKENMFENIDGMFAFCILDKHLNKIILARDRAGKKPLYLYKDSSRLLFASELNAVKKSIPNIDINENNIYGYLRNGFFFDTETPYKNVSEVKPGHIYMVDCKTLDISKKQYFNILKFYKKDKITNYKHIKTTLDDMLHKSIKGRLLSSDLEVGAFLSGGIDSSLIVAIASKYTDNLKTFTVKFDGAYDESHLAQLTAKRYNTRHYELNISMNVKSDIENILANYGEPFMDSSAVPSYYVSKEAKRYVTVVLNGDGADELFGGYRRYVPIANNLIGIAKYFSILLPLLPKPHDKKSIYNYLYRLLSISDKKGVDFYNSATNDIFEDIYHFKKNSTIERMEKFINSIEKEDISNLSKILYLDFMLILQNDLLKKMDIATMSHSLEGRSPFLSKYILEFAPTVQDNYKIKNFTTKFILRDLAKKYLDEKLINQPKRGFEVPLKQWVENDLKENIFDTLSSKCYSKNFIDKKFIDKLLHKKVHISDEKRAKILWTLYSLEVWKKYQ